MCSAHLRNFRWEGSVARASCPICGDSKKKKSKARLYFLPYKQTYVTKCHNCGIAWPLAMFLKQTNSVLHEEFEKEKALEKLANTHVKQEEQYAIPRTFDLPATILRPEAVEKLKKISQLPLTHPARVYIDSRKIPVYQHFRIFYTDNYRKWVNSILPGKYEHEGRNDPRIVLPLLDRHKKIFGAIGRSIGNLSESNMRYLTVMFDKNFPKIFGLEQCNLLKKFYIFEGPIDSLFISNSIAMGGTSVSTKDVLDLSNGVFVFDNEPRSPELIRLMEKCIVEGNKICIWPSYVEQKDINEMILAGATSLSIREHIDNNTFSGLEAELKLIQWRKV